MVRFRLERRAGLPLLNRIAILAIAVLAGSFFGAGLIWATGYDPGKAALAIYDSSFGSGYALAQSLAASIPLVIIALGTAVAFKVHLWNIGGDGQFYLGAVFATAVELVGGPGGWPAFLLIPVMLLAAFIGGAFWALVPAWLRTYFGVNEILTTLMLNYVAALWVSSLVYGPWKDPLGHNFPYSPTFTPNAIFRGLGAGQLHVGVFVPLVIAVILLFALGRTRWGYELRVIGENPAAARYAGMNVRRNLMLAMLISGGLAGIAGMVQVSGVSHLLSDSISNRYGYTGIIVAYLAQLQPMAILIVGVLFGALLNGGFAVSQVGIPQEVGLMLQGAILIFVLGIGDLFSRYRLRIIFSGPPMRRLQPLAGQFSPVVAGGGAESQPAP